MFINPKKAIREGWLKGVPEADIQPNAVDIAVETLWEIDVDSKFYLWHNDKNHRTREELKPTQLGTESHAYQDMWKFKKGKVYDFMSPAYVEMPKGVVGWLVTRSTLNRNGVFVLSGLYDSGYKGHINGILYNKCGESWVQPGSRVAQFIMAASDSEGLYTGSYNVNEGELWHEKLVN